MAYAAISAFQKSTRLLFSAERQLIPSLLRSRAAAGLTTKAEDIVTLEGASIAQNGSIQPANSQTSSTATEEKLLQATMHGNCTTKHDQVLVANSFGLLHCDTAGGVVSAAPDHTQRRTLHTYAPLQQGTPKAKRPATTNSKQAPPPQQQQQNKKQSLQEPVSEIDKHTRMAGSHPQQDTHGPEYPRAERSSSEPLESYPADNMLEPFNKAATTPDAITFESLHIVASAGPATIPGLAVASVEVQGEVAWHPAEQDQIPQIGIPIEPVNQTAAVAMAAAADAAAHAQGPAVTNPTLPDANQCSSPLMCDKKMDNPKVKAVISNIGLQSNTPWRPDEKEPKKKE